MSFAHGGLQACGHVGIRESGTGCDLKSHTPGWRPARGHQIV